MSDKSNAGSGSDGEDAFEEAYEVEEIRDKMRGDDDEYLYYVKWVGWESDTNTWEPIEHLADCPDKLAEFEKKWRRKQDLKKERRREEKERKRQQRRERELKAAARFKVDSDSDGGYDRGSVEARKEKKKVASSGDSDSGDEKRREKHKKHKEDKERRRERSRERRKEEEKKRQPKFFRDIKPEKILGVTTDPGELYFYIKWQDDKAEPGLVKAKEAYQKIPNMCLKFYEKHLVWNKKEAPVAAEKPESAKTEPEPVKSESKPTDEGIKEDKDKDNQNDATLPLEPAANNTKEEKGEKEEDDELDSLPAPVPAD